MLSDLLGIAIKKVGVDCKKRGGGWLASPSPPLDQPLMAIIIIIVHTTCTQAVL